MLSLLEHTRRRLHRRIRNFHLKHVKCHAKSGSAKGIVKLKGNIIPKSV